MLNQQVWGGESFKVIPFHSTVTDVRLKWLTLTQFVTWLDKWRQYNELNAEGFLTRETYLSYLSLSHTVSTMITLIKYLLQECELCYVLLGKFQTDQLESRFGHYRQLSGSNYLVSVQEVLQSEKKLKRKSLLKLYSASKGVITIRDSIGNFSDVKHQHCDDSFVKKFLYRYQNSPNVMTCQLCLLLQDMYLINLDHTLGRQQAAV